MPSIRPATDSDLPTIQELAVATRLFSVEDAPFLAEQFHAGQRGEVESPRWLVQQAEGTVQGAAYVAAEPYADRMHNLYFIAVAPESQGQGVGRSLLAHVEQVLRDAGGDHARTLVVETSSTDAYAETRAFYERRGFTREAQIREFYGPADHKVVFWKSLVTP